MYVSHPIIVTLVLKKIAVKHIFLAGLAGTHPLRGPNAEEFGPRFPPLSDAYDLELRRDVHKAWKAVIPSQSNRRLHEGVYAFAGGPRYVDALIDKGKAKTACHY